MVGGLLATIRGAGPLPGFSFGLETVDLPARLRRKGTSGPLLAGEAMANRHSHRVPFDHRPQLPAAAGRSPVHHFDRAFSIRCHTSATASTAGLDRGNSSPTGDCSSLIFS